jgi:putative sterol carrier protein
MIQFHVSGAESGNYYLKIARGTCTSFEGITANPGLTIHTPDTVWLRIARKELDGAQALQAGMYKAEGDLSMLLKFQEWFSS